jgi:hypothetical protein
MSSKKIIAQLFGCSVLAFFLGYYSALPEEPIEESSHIPSTQTQSSECEQLLKASNTEDDQAQADRIHKLNQQLKLAKSEIDDLQSKNSNLAKQIEQMDLPVSPSMEYPELIAKIDDLPLPLINEQLDKLFDNYALKRINNPRGFAKRLIDVALTDQEESTIELNITFSTSPLAGVRPLSESTSITKDDTVFAHITTSASLDETVIVKWRDLRTGEILSLTNQAMNTNGREQYVWMRPKKGWQPGRYGVSVYSMDDQVSPLGSAAFNLVAVSDPQPGGDSRVMQELISSGQALPKTTR